MAVRRESVRLELDDQFTSQMARAAAATALLRNELDGLNGAGRRVNTSSTTTNINNVARSADASGQSINQLTGRLGLLADAFLTLGPGLVPIGAVGVQAIGGLAAAATSAAVAGGAAIVAFQGVGDAVKAANEYAVEPSTANFEKMQAAMKAIGPEARNFVREFQAFRPVLTEIRDAAAAGLFPGLTASLDDFERLAPTIERILKSAASEVGSIIDDSAGSLASDRWAPFMAFLEQEVPTAVRSLSRIMGDLAHGASEMWMAFDPGNDSFLAWAENVANSFDKWASSSEGRDDIRAFLDYARETGPQVAELFSALVGALAAITQAAAPLGGPVLTALTAVARLVETVAESDMATPLLAAVAAMRLYGRVTAVATAAQARFNTTAAIAQRPAISNANRNTLNTVPTHLQAGLVGARPADIRAQAAAQRAAMAQTAAGLAALGLVATGTSEKIGLTNSAMLTLVGTMAGPWGAAAGATIGLTMDAAAANDELTASIEATNAALSSGDLTAGLDNLTRARTQLEAFKASVSNTSLLDAAIMKPGEAKNFIESIFGDSDVADAEKAIRAAEDYYAAMKRIADLKPVDAADGLNDLFNAEVAGEIANTTSLLYDFSAALAKAEGFLSKRGAMTEYERSLDGINAALKENGRTLNVQTEAGRANRDVLDGMAANGLRLAESLRGAAKEKFLQQFETQIGDAARTLGYTDKRANEFVKNLRAIGRTKVKPEVDLQDDNFKRKHRRAEADLNTLDRDEANPLVNLLDDPFQRKRRKVTSDLKAIDISRANPFVDANTNPFFTAIGGVRSNLASLDGDKATVTILTRHIEEYSTRRNSARVAEGSAADGATVPKTGRPYADRHLYMLADGEEVVSNRNGQADRYRGLLKAINANSRIPGYAAGGTTGPTTSAQPFPGFNAEPVNALAAAMHRLAGLTDRELHQREKILTKAIRLQEREIKRDERAAAREERESQALKERVDLLKQERDAIRDSIAQRFTANPFDRTTGEDNAAVDPMRALFEDTRAAQEMAALIQTLTSRGLTGDALTYLLQNASTDQIRGYANGSQNDLTTYAALFATRNQYANAAGMAGAVGDGVQGELQQAQVLYRAQLAEQKAANAELRQANRHLRQQNIRLDAIERTLERHEKQKDRRAKQQAKDTGAAVGDAVNGAATNGSRGRAPR